jgi:hypothetical protein
MTAVLGRRARRVLYEQRYDAIDNKRRTNYEIRHNTRYVTVEELDGLAICALRCAIVEVK